MLWAGAHCDPEEALAREASHHDRVTGMARLQASRVHDGVVYDVEIDATARYPKACAQLWPISWPRNANAPLRQSDRTCHLVSNSIGIPDSCGKETKRSVKSEHEDVFQQRGIFRGKVICVMAFRPARIINLVGLGS
ncbi:phosphotransferase-like protein [Rhodococcus pyridinivorans]|uniref:phosphotransferase-like protein n=1 Tax=Rhodococcus pyridinivorans TaxID=103816 RepID=UPI003D1575D2